MSAEPLAEQWWQPVADVWRGRRSGPALRVALAIVLFPLIANTVFNSPPPLGVYLNGMIIGCLYSLIAMGLILVYRANRIINFAGAGLGAGPAVAAVLLMSYRHWPYLAALLLVIVGAPLLGLLTEVLFIRRFAKAPRLILTVATIGVAQLLSFVEISLPGWIGGSHNLLHTFVFRTPLTRFNRSVGGVIFTGDHVLAVVVIVAAAAGLAAFFRFTSIGLSVRACAENDDRAALLGIPVRRVSTVVWMLAALVSAIGVFLRVPVVGGLPFNGLVGTTTLLYALAPAVIARMQSFPIAFAAGIGIGVLDQTTFYGTRNSTISGALILPIVLIALLAQRGRLSRAEDSGVASWRQVQEFRPIPKELRRVDVIVQARWVVGAVVLALFVAAPYLVGVPRRNLASLFVIYAIAGVSLVILTGWGGQISLGQFAFIGIGAAVAGGLAANHNLNFLLALLLAGVVGSLLAIGIGIPALRLPGLYLAVTTLAFAANAQYFFLQRRYFAWLLPKDQRYANRPVLWGRLDLKSDVAYYYLCLAVLALAVACGRSIRAHRSGRVMIAARENARAAQSYGINLARTRLAAFALSGFFAAVAGALFAYLQGVVDPVVFSPDKSVQIFAMAVIGGLTSVPGALAGAAYVVGFQYLLPKYQFLASGVGMLALLLFFPGGLAEVGYRLRDGFLRRVAAQRGIHVPSLVADSRHTVFDGRGEAEVLEAATEKVVDLGATTALATAGARPVEEAQS